MIERRRQEIELLRKKYGALQHGENLEWVLFKEFSLPPGWDREKIELVILVPPGYPVTAPDNFYVPPGLKTNLGAQPQNYTEGINILGRQWGQFSFHVEAGNWNPSADLLDGDNLLTFMIGVENRLREGK